MDKIERALLDILPKRDKIYNVLAVIPYDEDGGTRYVTLKGIRALTSADAVRYAVKILKIPEIDIRNDIEDVDEFLTTNEYGIVRVSRDLEHNKINKGSLVKSWYDILKTYDSELDNKEEVILYLMRKYGIRKNDLL